MKPAKTSLVLSAVIAGLIALQAGLGLALQQLYRDAPWIKATWYGNDWVTLVVAVPLLAVAIVLARRGTVRGTLLLLGMLGYSFYNYAYYLFGVTLNAFFPLYVVLMVLTAVTLMLALGSIDAGGIAERFRRGIALRIVGGYFAFVAVGFGFAWLAQWAAYVFAGKAPSIAPEAFKLVAALDLSVMMPLLGFGGVLLLLRNRWGYVVASVAAVQGTLYLLVLTVNSFVVAARGLGANEAPVWATFAVLTGASLAALLASVREHPAG